MKIVITMKPNGTYAATIPTEDGDYTIFSSLWNTDAAHRDPYDALRELLEEVFHEKLPPLRELNFDETGRAEYLIPLAAAIA